MKRRRKVQEGKDRQSAASTSYDKARRWFLRRAGWSGPSEGEIERILGRHVRRIASPPDLNDDELLVRRYTRSDHGQMIQMFPSEMIVAETVGFFALSNGGVPSAVRRKLSDYVAAVPGSLVGMRAALDVLCEPFDYVFRRRHLAAPALLKPPRSKWPTDGTERSRMRKRRSELISLASEIGAQPADAGVGQLSTAEVDDDAFVKLTLLLDAFDDFKTAWARTSWANAAPVPKKSGGGEKNEAVDSADELADVLTFAERTGQGASDATIALAAIALCIDEPCTDPADFAERREKWRKRRSRQRKARARSPAKSRGRSGSKS